VTLLCCHFARNLAYHRGGWHAGQLRRTAEFWVTVNGNFLDQCVLEWSKLFGITASDKKGAHYWGNVVADKSRFESEMFQQIDRTKFDEMFEAVRKYRNEFLSHLGQEKVMTPPVLNLAEHSVWFYHQYIVSNEAQPGDLAGLPTHLPDYYSFCDDEVQKIYTDPPSN
jgi:hypothetical protein